MWSRWAPAPREPAALRAELDFAGFRVDGLFTARAAVAERRDGFAALLADFLRETGRAFVLVAAERRPCVLFLAFRAVGRRLRLSACRFWFPAVRLRVVARARAGLRFAMACLLPVNLDSLTISNVSSNAYRDSAPVILRAVLPIATPAERRDPLTSPRQVARNGGRARQWRTLNTSSQRNWRPNRSR
jgi:hypothetical protein